MNNKLFLSVMAAAVATPALVTVVDVEAANVNAFKDVSEKSFAYEAILDLTKKEIIMGYKDGTFKPGQAITRGQFAAIIARALDLPKAESNFKDVPKSKSLYDGISRADAAGIVLGDTDGKFYPDREVSRGDVAVMVDRALQLKGDYKKQATLKFKDNGSIPRYALESVKRMTNYGVIAGMNDNTFSATKTADRAQGSVFVWRMLNLLENGTVPVPPVTKPPVTEPPVVQPPVIEPPIVAPPVTDTPIVSPPVVNPPITVPVEGPPNGDARNYSYKEIENRVGKWQVIERRNGNGTLVERDLVQEYYDLLRDPNVGGALRHQTPEQYFANFIESDFNDTHILYAQAYPNYELIALNGIPYRHTKYYPEALKNPQYQEQIRLNNLIPNPPKESGRFLIDIPTFDANIVTYKNANIQIEKLAVKPSGTASGDYLVDLKGVFNDTSEIVVSSNGLSVSYGGKTLELTAGSNQAKLNGQTVNLSEKVTVHQGTVLVPIQSVAKNLGLSTRKTSPTAFKIEVANYNLPVSLTDTNLDGWE